MIKCLFQILAGICLFTSEIKNNEKFQLEYFSKKIDNLQGKLRFEAPQTLVIDGKEVARIYDATVEHAGKITKYELKNWAGWSLSIKTQFIKDIQKTRNLIDIQLFI